MVKERINAEGVRRMKMGHYTRPAETARTMLEIQKV
jgi:hypothetical protein